MNDNSTPAQIGKNILGMVQGLTPLNPAMSNWLLLDHKSYEYATLAAAAPKIADLVENNVSTDDDDQSDPKDGYRITVKGSKIPSENGASDSIFVMMTAGSARRNFGEFEVGSYNFPLDFDIITYPVFRGALEAMVANWPCPWALATVFSLTGEAATWDGVTPIWENPEPEGGFRGAFGGAWIAYLSKPLALGVASPPELFCEPTPGGGVIISAVRERIDEANPEHMRRSRLLEVLLNEQIGVKGPSPLNAADHVARVGPY
jgi:hypothetical protein